MIETALAMAVALAPASDRGEIETLVLDIEGIDPAAFRDAMRTRLPGRTQVPFEQSQQRRNSSWAYVQVRPTDGGWALALILPDGRAFYRDVRTLLGSSPARQIASALANLVASIEDDAVTADRIDVVVPGRPPVEPPHHAAVIRPASQPRPTLDVAVGLRGLASWAVGPPAPGGFNLGGSSTVGRVVFDNGLLVGGEVGAGGTRAHDYRLTRVRVGAHVGYLRRTGPFDFVFSGGARLEPWFVRSPEGAESLRASQREQAAALLGGMFVTVEPGVRAELGQSARVRIAPYVAAGMSTLLHRGGGTARVSRETDSGTDALFRMGGVELETGLSVELWWTVPAPRRGRRSGR